VGDPGSVCVEQVVQVENDRDLTTHSIRIDMPSGRTASGPDCRPSEKSSFHPGACLEHVEMERDGADDGD